MAMGLVALAAVSTVTTGSRGTVSNVALAGLAHLSATGLAFDFISSSASTSVLASVY